MPVSGSTNRRTASAIAILRAAPLAPEVTHLAIRFQAREIIAHIIFQVRGDRALIDRLTGRSPVLRQHLLIGNERWVVRARQITLALLSLRLAVRSDLALHLVGTSSLVTGVVRLVDQAAVAAPLPAAGLSGAVRIDVRLPALPLSESIGLRAAA